MLASANMDTAQPLARPHWLSYSERLESRPLSAIDLVVLHCTELPDMDTARQYGERVLYASGTGNSGHFYIDRDGRLEQYAPLNRIAHHVRGYNPRSIGIELVNRGRWPHWLDSRHQAMDEPYTSAQLDVLLQLLDQLPGPRPRALPAPVVGIQPTRRRHQRAQGTVLGKGIGPGRADRCGPQDRIGGIGQQCFHIQPQVALTAQMVAPAGALDHLVFKRATPGADAIGAQDKQPRCIGGQHRWR